MKSRELSTKNGDIDLEGQSGNDDGGNLGAN